MRTLLLSPEIFSGEGGIMRILRLYLKAACEISGSRGSVACVSLNDGEGAPAGLHEYSGENLERWAPCGRSKIRFAMLAVWWTWRSETVICGHIGQLPVVWIASLFRPSIRYHLIAHGIEVWRPYTFIERRALRRATSILCVSSYTREQILRRCPLPAESLPVLANALDPSLVPKSRSAIEGTSPTILSISRLSASDSYKGIGHLISAMPAVLMEIPAARLRIVGRGDGRAELEELVRELHLEDAVTFLGFLSDELLGAEYDRCRLFALPSEKEGFGLVYLEAMAHGRPCLAALSGGAPEVLTPETGILIGYGDIPSISRGIIAAMKTDWNIEALLARAQHFSYPAFRSRLAELVYP